MFWRLFFVLIFLPFAVGILCYYEENKKISVTEGFICFKRYSRSLDATILRTTLPYSEIERGYQGYGYSNGDDYWDFQCNTHFCNNGFQCFSSHGNTTFCQNQCIIAYTFDGTEYKQTRGCGEPISMKLDSEDITPRCTTLSNGTIVCSCYREKCNDKTFGIKCYHSVVGSSVPVLVDCPYLSDGCFIDRHPDSDLFHAWKIKNVGCNLYNKREKCYENGCNYPMSCWDDKSSNLVMCEKGVKTCNVVYRKTAAQDWDWSFSGCGQKLAPEPNGTSCFMDGTSTKHCVCTGDMCNYLFNQKIFYCHIITEDGREFGYGCPFGTTQCYSIGDVNSGKAIKKDCLIINEAVSCRRENDTKICVCQGRFCNKGELPRINCYVYNGTELPKLEVCPFEAIECYVARDPVSKTLIEAGCDVSDHGEDEIVRCSTDGCNYPIYCYDSAQETVVQCEVGVTECYTSFVKVGERDARVLAGCYSKNNSISNEHHSVCASDDKNDKNCVCFGDMCNYETHYESINCYVSNGTEPAKLIKCPMGTTHCYSVGDLSTDEVIEVGCSIFDEKEKCRFQDNSKICVCRGETCNNEIPRIKCFVSNETTPTVLETCPLKTTECFVARDPKTQKLIEAGCDVSDHGSQLVEKCSSDGCNYPMYCYDSSKNAVAQCEIGDVGCYVEFEEQGPHETKQVSGCSPNINSNVSNLSEAVCSLNGGRKQCICSGDMCNHETHFESISCQVSKGSGSMESIKCPLGTTECYIVGEKDGTNNMGCSIFEGGSEGCSMEDGVKTCFCHDDTCNQNVSQIHCYIANQTTPATLEVCPFEAVGCYVARDEQTWELIEAGCDVGDEGGHHVEKCFGDGCNHPFHCYDVGRNNMQQCDHQVTACFTTFERTDGVLKTSSGCDLGNLVFHCHQMDQLVW